MHNMGTCQRMLLVVFILILQIQANFLAFAQMISCLNNTGNTSTYRVNLKTALSDLSSKLDRNGFANASVGQDPDRVNAIILCRGDILLDACRLCLQSATRDLLEKCPNQKKGINWNDAICMLRYSDNAIFETKSFDLAGSAWSVSNTSNAMNPIQFEDELNKLMEYLTGQAADGGQLRKAAVGSASVSPNETIYSLVQCTPGLSPGDCNSCLIDAAGDISRCCKGKGGGRVLRPSCNLRFEVYPFYDETTFQELAAPAPPPPPPPSPPPGKGSENTTKTVIIVVVSIAACLMVAVSIGIVWRKRTKKLKQTEETYETLGEGGDEINTPESLQYTFSTIRAATNDFSDENKLGQGGFGAVYKGELSNGQEIAVKRLSRNSRQGDLEFKNEVLLLARLQHRNLVRLLGFCLEGIEKLLVYEFVANASLDLFIFGRIKHTYLYWDRRYKIIVGIARGLLYLHEDSRLKIIHRDLKASNVLLDGDMNPKIADFGMARLFGQDETQANTSRIVGTYGYMAPEYAMHGQFSVKSDVFSFGVLVLEIISGKRNNCFRSGENVQDLLSFVWKNWREGTITNTVDPLILRSSDPNIPAGAGAGSMRDILRCIHIGLLCVQENAADRPTMASIVLMLSSVSLTLALPSEPAFYFDSTASYHQYSDTHIVPNPIMGESYDDDSRDNLQLDQINKDSSKSNYNAAHDHSSKSNNADASITELHPR